MLKKDDKFILGEGRKELLELIDEKGTISEAAKKMDMSYRHAWGIIRKMENAVESKLVESKRGGQRERGTVLTPAANSLISDYEDLKEQHKGEVYRDPSLTVDGIIEKDKEVLLIRRRDPPYQGEYALPGGFVDYGESVEDAVMREVKEETGLKTEINKLIGVYSSPDRDPRGHMITTAFSLEIKKGSLRSGSDAEEAEFFDLDSLPTLAFDHSEIIEDYISNL